MPREDFASYRIVQRIGSGGAGTVFAAEHGQLRRTVAIKILHPHLVGEGSEERMLAEAHTLSLLDHPGIVKVLGSGVTPDGRVYLVMEHLVGEPLYVRLRRGKLPERDVVSFARQLASALEVAHGAGIVHRDLKPENVFVIPDPELPGGERVKLLDFGIAKREGHERTATGVVLGTPAYMAPEQFLGSRHVDPRADIYSLGVVMYHMVTGTPPFTGRDTGELLAEHAYCQPASPSRIGGASPLLSATIKRCLAKRPEDRFATMGELGAVLRALEGPPASAASAPGKARTTRRREFDDRTTKAAIQPKLLGAAPISTLIPVRMARGSEPPPLPGLPLARGSERRLEPTPEPVPTTELEPAPAFEPAPAPEPAYEPATEPEVEPTTEPRPRRLRRRRSARWPWAVVAVVAVVAAAGVALALLRPLWPAEAAPAAPREAAAAPAVPAPPAPAAAAIEPTFPDLPAPRARSAAAPRAGEPARAPRPPVRRPDSGRKSTKEGFENVTPPTLF